MSDTSREVSMSITLSLPITNRRLCLGLEQVVRTVDPAVVVMSHTYSWRDFAPKAGRALW